jgi:hypothetical protein
LATNTRMPAGRAGKRSATAPAHGPRRVLAAKWRPLNGGRRSLH